MKRIAPPVHLPALVRASQPDLAHAERRLIHIPILHTQADMGALGAPVRAQTIAKLGQAGWERNVSLIDGVWDRIEAGIESWSLPYDKVRIYQDALPVCGRETQIVSDLATAGSRNHRLLLFLAKRGAIIMGTESASLLVQEYKLAKQALGAGGTPAARLASSHYESRSQALLTERDRFIAERINSTLQRGETGLLFVGMLHSLENWLAKDIRVEHPFPPQAGLQSQKP
jgi:hypothetical protein